MDTTAVKNPLRILRLRQVIERTGLSRSTIYDHISIGEFPKQISLGPRSVGWVESEIEEWIANRIEASRSVSKRTRSDAKSRNKASRIAA